MKKIISFSLLVTCLGIYGGIIATSNLGYKPTKQAKADELEKYIPMESGFFTNWTDDAGAFPDRNATFWSEAYSFEALDTFYSGESKEPWTGTLTSRKWKQATQYIYFQLGAAKDYVENPVHLVIHYGSYSENFFNNTFVENPMTLRYFKVPDEKFAELTASNDDFEMYIEIVDTKESDYGFANFGYLHVNQTAESTSDAMRYFLNNLSSDTREWEVNKRKDIYNSYFANAAQREIFLRTVDNANEDFENNEQFLNHWYFDANYFNNDGETRHFDSVISTASARTAEASNMPYNKTGNGLFKGWYDDNGSGGFTATDAAIYRFVSRPFVLGGNGLVSVKMAGRSASLHVIDTNTQTDLAWADLRTYNGDGGQDNVALGGMNTVTMVRHYINLEQYVGKTIQLAIADIYNSGWAASYFDELITKYETYPGFKVDFVTQTNGSGTFYATYLDRFINSTNFTNDSNGIKYNGDNDINKENESAILNHVDETDFKAAYSFVNSFLAYARDNSRGTELCSVITSDTMKEYISTYNDLSESVKRIVCDSLDYQRYNATSENWYVVAPTALALGDDIAYIAVKNNMQVVTFKSASANSSISVANTDVAIIGVTCLAIVLIILPIVLVIRRKKNQK